MLAGLVVKGASSQPDPALDAALDKLEALSGDLVVFIPEPPFLEVVRDCVEEETPLRFTYAKSATAVSDRVIEPYKVFRQLGSWYVSGKELGSDTIKYFRVDRMLDAEMTKLPRFHPPEDVDVPDRMPIDHLLRHVIVRVPERLRNLLADDYSIDELRELDGGRIEVRVGVLGEERLDYLLLRLGPEAEWLEPELDAAPLRGRAHAPRCVRAMRLRVAAVLVAALSCLAACASDQIVPIAVPPSTTTTITPNPAGRIVVLAATPIAPTVHILGEHFTAAHPGVEIAITDGSANGLVNQISGGLAGDVFASVGSPAVDDLAIDGHLAVRTVRVRTRPPRADRSSRQPGGTQRDRRPRESRPHDRVVQPRQRVCGQATDAAFMKSGITASPDVVATDGAAVVQAVTTGRASAGLAYRTDVTASVSFLDLGVDLEADVPAIAVKLAATTNPAAADAFIAYLFSPEAKQVLATIGLVPPAASPAAVTS